MTVDYTKIADKMNKETAKKSPRKSAKKASAEEAGPDAQAAGSQPVKSTEVIYNASAGGENAAENFTPRNILFIALPVIAMFVFGELFFIAFVISLIWFFIRMKSSFSEAEVQSNFLVKNLRYWLEGALPPKYSGMVKQFFRQEVYPELEKLCRKPD